MTPTDTALFQKYPVLAMILLYVCGASCNAPDTRQIEAPKAGMTHYISLTDSADEGSLADYITDIQFIPLETRDSCLLAAIDKVIFLDGRYYLLDKTYSSLKVFGGNGKYITTIGRLGRGRNEFTDLKDFTLSPDRKTLILLCNDKKSLLKFDLSGNYTGSERTDLFATSFATLNDATYYYTNQNESEKSKQFDLVALGKEGNVKERLFPFQIFKAEINFSGFLIRNDSGLLFSSPFSDTAFQIAGDRIYPKYIFAFGNDKLPDTIKSSFARFLRAGPRYSYLGSTMIETKDNLLFSYFGRKKKGFGIYSKGSRALHVLNFETDPLASLLPAPVGIKDSSEFISCMSVPQLLQQLEKNNSLKQEIKASYPHLYDRLAGMTKADNPLLVIFRLRTTQPTRLASIH